MVDVRIAFNEPSMLIIFEEEEEEEGSNENNTKPPIYDDDDNEVFVFSDVTEFLFKGLISLLLKGLNQPLLVSNTDDHGLRYSIRFCCCNVFSDCNNEIIRLSRYPIPSL
jgi:hypothetical protein